MVDLEKDGSNRQTTGSNAQEEANIYEDEINLIDYSLVLWKQKWFIFLASVLPALVVGLTLFLGPRDYKISYTYDIKLDEKAFKILGDKFYSTENLEKLIRKLQDDGFQKYAEKLTGARTAEDLKKFVSFEIVEENLLVMTVETTSERNIRQIASICRENFEHIIPLYSVREKLNSKITGFKKQMADIEETRYTLNLQLERKKSTLEKLKISSTDGLGRLPGSVVLQFNNVGKNSDFLPLAYQVQAAKTQIINLEEQIMANKEKYDYYTSLLKLNEKLFINIKKMMSSRFTLEQFHTFLVNTLVGYKENDQQMQDYLNAYIKRIENKIASVMPLVERPKVYPVAKGTIKKSTIVFAAALMLSVFASFFLEGLKKRRAPAS